MVSVKGWNAMYNAPVLIIQLRIIFFNYIFGHFFPLLRVLFIPQTLLTVGNVHIFNVLQNGC